MNDPNKDSIHGSVVFQNSVLNGINRILQEGLAANTEEELARICLAVAEDLTQSEFGFIDKTDAAGNLDDIAISDSGLVVCDIPRGSGHQKRPEDLKPRGIFGRVILEGKPLYINDLALHPDSVGLPEGHPPVTSFLGVPLFYAGETIGMIGLGNRPGGYRHRDLEVAEALAYAIVWIVVNKREVRKREMEHFAMAKLQELSTRLVRANDLNTLLQEILLASTVLTGTDKGNIQFIDPKSGCLKIAAHTGLGERFLDHFAEDGCAATCSAAQRSMQRVIVEDITAEPALQGNADLQFFLEDGIRAVQSTPLITRDGRLVGMLSNQFRNPHRLSEHELRYLDLLARMAADFIESKQTQETLERNQRQLQKMVRERAQELKIANVQDIIMQIGANGNIEYLSPSFERITGYAIEERIGKSAFLTLHPDDRDKVVDIFKSTRDGKFSVDKLEYRIRRADDRYIWLEANGQALLDGNGNFDGSILILRNITERKQAEEALRQSEERFFKIFYNHPDMMTIVDVEDNSLVEVNRTFVNILGYTHEEVIGRTPLELGFVTEKDHVAAFYEKLNAEEKVLNFPLDFRAKSGEIINTLCSTETIRVEGKDYRLAVVRDVTKEKRMEAEIARLDRLNLVGEMAASIGHEIRNPMTSIRGFLQLINETQDAAKFQEYYRIIIQELDRVNAIISNYLSLAKNKAVDLKPGCLNTIIQSLYPIIKAGASYSDKQVNLELVSPGEFLMDQNEMRQLVLNLTRNGLEAMDAGGVLTIRTRGGRGEAVLEVEDQGTGIAPELLERLGTPFATTKENGTGLGLPVCYSIAQRHNARIEVDTGPEGTTFCVRFPINGARSECSEAQ